MYVVSRADLAKAKAWYTELLGKPPYFDEPFYVGFNVGGFELSLDPTDEEIVHGNSVNTYWGVANIEQSYARCLALGAKADTEIRDVGGDIKVATVEDPFGNVLGLIENPGFKVD